jgi:hypothetical protein
LPKVRQWLRKGDLVHPAFLGLLSAMREGLREAATLGHAKPVWVQQAWSILEESARSPQPDWGESVRECFRQLDPQGWRNPGYAAKPSGASSADRVA